MVNTTAEKRKGVIALIFLSLVFASMGIFSRYLSTNFDLFEQTYLRIGTAFLVGIIIFYKKINFGKLKNLPKKDLGIFIFRAITLYTGVVFLPRLSCMQITAMLLLSPHYQYFQFSDMYS